MIIPHHLVSSTSFLRRRPIQASFGSALIVVFLYRFWFLTTPFVPAVPKVGEIPPKIWQIFLLGAAPLSETTNTVGTWISKNQDYSYTLVSNDGGKDFVRKNYALRPEISSPFLELRSPILHSDFLRYLLLEAEGGVYTDLDTTCTKPISDWVPDALRSRVHAIVGIEYDQRDDEPYIGMSATRMQFCQWTMAASKGHPLMTKVVKSVVGALHRLARRKGKAIRELEPTDDEVIEVTGPAIWTRAVMESLSEATGTTMSYVNMTGMKEPTLFGDILILPIDGFGAGQPHSGSTRDGDSPNAYSRHLFRGSWKHGWNG
ncbi:initiation-specific alpha-1,6-mannosyltransferase [Physcia stellaris]|nr:initiation-specific alpha-1,6-mannosyltransferase [Physcia stellaris]